MLQKLHGNEKYIAKKLRSDIFYCWQVTLPKYALILKGAVTFIFSCAPTEQHVIQLFDTAIAMPLHVTIEELGTKRLRDNSSTGPAEQHSCSPSSKKPKPAANRPQPKPAAKRSRARGQLRGAKSGNKPNNKKPSTKTGQANVAPGGSDAEPQADISSSNEEQKHVPTKKTKKFLCPIKGNHVLTQPMATADGCDICKELATVVRRCEQCAIGVCERCPGQQGVERAETYWSRVTPRCDDPAWNDHRNDINRNDAKAWASSEYESHFHSPFSLSLSFTLFHSLSLSFTLFLYVSLSLSLSRSPSLSLSLPLSFSLFLSFSLPHMHIHPQFLRKQTRSEAELVRQKHEEGLDCAGYSTSGFCAAT